MGRNERHFISRGRQSISSLEGSQAMPARPSDKDRMILKTLGWRVVKSKDRHSGILIL
jgi:hypothetical protein